MEALGVILQAIGEIIKVFSDLNSGEKYPPSYF